MGFILWQLLEKKFDILSTKRFYNTHRLQKVNN